MKLRFKIVEHKGKRWAVVFDKLDYGDTHECHLAGEDGSHAVAYIKADDLGSKMFTVFRATGG